MAMSKAAKWISFAVPAPPTPIAQTLPASKPVAPSVHTSDEKQFGLENFGNTCYANSVLQALYFCAPFRDLVLQSTDAYATLSAFPQSPPGTLTPPPQHLQRRKSERAKLPPPEPTPAPDPTIWIPSSPPTLFSALRSLFLYISKNPQNKGVVSPRAFIEKLREVNELFRSSMHQDAHEFLNYLLNKIVEEIQGDKNHRDGPLDTSGEDLSASIPTLSSGPPPTTSTASQNDATLVQRLFEGTLTSETRCLTCETVSSRDESFLDLSIDIEQNSSVTACLRQFSASEMLCQKNKFFCDSCCGLQEAEKRMKIKKLPNVLALHLKRFKYQEDVQKYIKLAYRVAFPFELRLFNTVDDAPDPDRLYELFSIVVHIGTGPHHGHYITIIKGPRSWLVFDDDKIDTIKESEISKYFGDSPSGSAYVLYYQAVNLDPVLLGLRPTESAPVPVAVPSVDVLPVSSETQTESSAETEAAPAVPPGLGSEEDMIIGVAITSNDIGSDTSGSVPATAPATPATPATPASNVAVAPSPPISPKKSLPILRVTTSPSSPSVPLTPTTPSPNGKAKSPRATSGGTLRGSRKHGEGPTSPRRDEVSSRRPSTAPGGPSPALQTVIPPVPPLPSLQVNGKDPGLKGKGKEKEPDRKPSLWFKRRSLNKEKTKEKEKEKEREGTHEKDKEREREKDVTSSAGSVAPSMSTAPSQSTATSEGGGVWRRRSFRLGHSKRHSASQSTFEGELDTSARSSPALSPVPATPAASLPSESTATPAAPTPAAATSSTTTTTTAERASPVHTPVRSRTSSATSASSAAVMPTPRSSPHPLPNGNNINVPLPPVPPPKLAPALRTPSVLSSPVSPSRKSTVPPSSPRTTLRPSTAGASTSAGAGLKKRHTIQPAVPPPSSRLNDEGPATDSEAQRRAVKERRGAGAETGWRPRSAQAMRPATSEGAGARTESPAELHEGSERGGESGHGHGHGHKEGGAARLQRAARKLSLTAPLFGLGRHHHHGANESEREMERIREKEREKERKEEKEREKEREREERREKRRTRPPSAFLMTASAAAIAGASR